MVRLLTILVLLVATCATIAAVANTETFAIRARGLGRLADSNREIQSVLTTSETASVHKRQHNHLQDFQSHNIALNYSTTDAASAYEKIHPAYH